MDVTLEASLKAYLDRMYLGFNTKDIKLQFVDWTSHATIDKLEPQIEARSNASGLTPPRWLWRRVRL
jgi:hypothetical protein